MALNGSNYHYSVIQRRADKAFNIQGDDWEKDIFRARRFEGQADERDKSINEALRQIEKHSKKYNRDHYTVLNVEAHFNFDVVRAEEEFEPDEPRP